MSRALVKQADMLSALTELFPLWEETGIILINNTKNIPQIAASDMKEERLIEVGEVNGSVSEEMASKSRLE